jgi:hypothetical protein
LKEGKAIHLTTAQVVRIDNAAIAELTALRRARVNGAKPDVKLYQPLIEAVSGGAATKCKYFEEKATACEAGGRAKYEEWGRLPQNERPALSLPQYRWASEYYFAASRLNVQPKESERLFGKHCECLRYYLDPIAKRLEGTKRYLPAKTLYLQLADLVANWNEKDWYLARARACASLFEVQMQMKLETLGTMDYFKKAKCYEALAKNCEDGSRKRVFLAKATDMLKRAFKAEGLKHWQKAYELFAAGKGNEAKSEYFAAGECFSRAAWLSETAEDLQKMLSSATIMYTDADAPVMVEEKGGIAAVFLSMHRKDDGWKGTRCAEKFAEKALAFVRSEQYLLAAEFYIVAAKLTNDARQAGRYLALSERARRISGDGDVMELLSELLWMRNCLKEDAARVVAEPVDGDLPP